MFKIGDFSKLCRVPASMLRYYADLGLLEPAQTDKFTGYRYYTADQIPRLNRILALRDLGLSLEQIKALLDENLPPDEIRGMLRLKQAEIEQQIQEEQARLARVAARLRQIEQETHMPVLEVVVKHIEIQHVLGLRETIPVPTYLGKLMHDAFAALDANRIQPAHPPIAIFHDEDYQPSDIDVELAIPVAESVNANLLLTDGRQLSAYDLPAIPLAACAIHAASHDTVEATYTALGQWIADNGYRIAGVSREIYLTRADSPSGPITEIQWPVEKA
ncbi:MAG: MerR family transcriptional regulator [Chloroflexota bacterium]